MTMLITLQQASDHLRRDTTADDNDLTLKIHAASGAVLNYLKTASPYTPEVDEDGNPVLDEDGEPTYTDQVRWEVQVAVLLMTGFLYKDRDENRDGAYEMGYLPKPVTALLYPLRDPAME